MWCFASRPWLGSTAGLLPLHSTFDTHLLLYAILRGPARDTPLRFLIYYTTSGITMSYRGRPSKGCEPCRARKVKVRCVSPNKLRSNGGCHTPSIFIIRCCSTGGN